MKGSLGLLLSVMALVALKDLDREIIMGLVLKVWSFFVIAMIILVNLGIVVDKVSVQTNKTWHGMGYSHGNLFHASVSIIIIMYLYRRKEKVTFVETMLAVGVNFLVYQYSASKSGMIIGVGAAILFYLYKLICGKEKLNKIAMVGLCFGMLMIVVLSFVLPRAYNWNWAGNEIPSVLNRMLTGRIQLAKTSLISDPLTLFGNGASLSAFVDNAYVFLLMGYGIVPTIMVGILYIIAVISMMKRGDYYGVIVIFLFVLYGSVEQFFVNAFMNYSVLFVGNEIMNIVIRNEERKG